MAMTDAAPALVVGQVWANSDLDGSGDIFQSVPWRRQEHGPLDLSRLMG